MTQPRGEEEEGSSAKTVRTAPPSFCFRRLFLFRSSSVDTPPPASAAAPASEASEAPGGRGHEAAAEAAAAVSRQEEEQEEVEEQEVEEEEEEEEAPALSPPGPPHTSPDHVFGSEVREPAKALGYAMRSECCIYSLLSSLTPPPPRGAHVSHRHIASTAAILRA